MPYIHELQFTYPDVKLIVRVLIYVQLINDKIVSSYKHRQQKKQDRMRMSYHRYISTQMKNQL
jgi:hypothetical protein